MIIYHLPGHLPLIRAWGDRWAPGVTTSHGPNEFSTLLGTWLAALLIRLEGFLFLPIWNRNISDRLMHLANGVWKVTDGRIHPFCPRVFRDIARTDSRGGFQIKFGIKSRRNRPGHWEKIIILESVIFTRFYILF